MAGRSGPGAGSVAAAADLLAGSRRLVAMTGAGISVESGIPPFRGPDGLWTRHGAPAPDGYRIFLADPEAWWRREVERSVEPWVRELREAVLAARPNAGHLALAELEAAGVLRATITQNIDGLHQEAGSRKVIEVHGSRHKLRCVSCGLRTPRPTMFPDRPVPPCPECGGPVKYDSVMFGEPIPADALRAAREEADAADCVLVVGSSSTVRPAGGLPRIAKAGGAALIEVNTSATRLTDACDVVVRGSAARALPALVTATLERATGYGPQYHASALRGHPGARQESSREAGR